MKIGFDISQTGKNKAGCGYFADSLIQALTGIDQENEYILYSHFGSSFWDPEAKRNTRKIELSNVSNKLIGNDYEESITFWNIPPTNAEEQLGNPDIIHANNFFCPKGLKHSKVVYTLHDLNFLECPELTTEQNWNVCFGGVFAAAIYADFVISVSNYSKSKFVEFFPHYPIERIQVVYEGSRFYKYQKYSERDKKPENLESNQFWLTVGTLEPRKNLRRLLRAFSIFIKKAEVSYPLVLAGGEGWLEDDLQEFIQNLNLIDNVKLLGYVSDEELSWLYSNCFGFIYPSLYEGFGLPVLEAMGMGAAVITSNTTSLPEVGGSAVHYVNPLDEHEIIEALEKLTRDNEYRNHLKRKATAQAKKYSWEKAALEVIDIYDQVINMPKFGDPSDEIMSDLNL